MGGNESVTERYNAAEVEITAALAELNAGAPDEPGHDAAIERYFAARAALGTREMLVETERRQPGLLAYGGALAPEYAPSWYRQLLAASAGALEQERRIAQ